MIKAAIVFIPFIFILSCGHHPQPLEPGSLAGVRDSVQLMAGNIAKDVSAQGPVAWNRYFEDSTGFFMASDGQLAFPDYDAAKNFINNTLVKSIRTIELHWNNIRINPLTDKLAVLAANFHEDITDTTGKKIPVDGYFTGIAHQTSLGWKLYNAHWSKLVTR